VTIRGAAITTILITITLVACVGVAGTAWNDLNEANERQSEVQRLEREIAELEAEADLAESEAEKALAMSAAERARAQQLDAQAEIEAARAEQIRAAGEKVESEANAYVHRELGSAAARAIDRQGRLLSWYVAADALGVGRLLLFGILLGLAVGIFGLLALAEAYKRGYW
jgi:hypothetical protein